LGAILLAEPITITTVLAGAVIIASVAVVIRAEPQTDPAALPEVEAPPALHAEESGVVGYGACAQSEA
jgi:hypothetical protein